MRFLCIGPGWRLNPVSQLCESGNGRGYLFYYRRCVLFLSVHLPRRGSRSPWGCPFSFASAALHQPVPDALPGSTKDIDVAVAAAREALNTTWGKNVSGFERAKLLNKLADLMERDAQVLAELESLNNGKPVRVARCVRSRVTRRRRY